MLKKLIISAFSISLIISCGDKNKDGGDNGGSVSTPGKSESESQEDENESDDDNKGSANTPGESESEIQKDKTNKGENINVSIGKNQNIQKDSLFLLLQLRNE